MVQKTGNSCIRDDIIPVSTQSVLAMKTKQNKKRKKEKEEQEDPYGSSCSHCLSNKSFKVLR